METDYYDGCKLLSLKDIDGNTPELYMCTTNRTAGKTTFFSRMIVRRFLNKREKFGLIYRFNYELSDISEKFFKDIKGLFFPSLTMSNKSRAKGIYHDLYIDGEHCGYAFSLNAAEQLKKYSHLFSDTSCMFMDEFQSETNHYCGEEIRKFLSLHTTVARGQGKQRRYVPVYMCANTVTLINPYYAALGIASRLKTDTKFLKGNGYVLEQGYNASAYEALAESGIAKAFASSDYIAYAAQGVYLLDSAAFIENPKGNSRYVFTIRYKGSDYGVREFDNLGIMYVTDKIDDSCPTRIAVTTEDHNINYVMLKRNFALIDTMRYLFEKGCFRFKNIQCKEALIACLSY